MNNACENGKIITATAIVQEMDCNDTLEEDMTCGKIVVEGGKYIR